MPAITERPNRRAFITGIVAALAAPAIVKAEVLMPVRTIIKPYVPLTWPGWLPCDGRLITRSMYAELFAVIANNPTAKRFGEFIELPLIDEGSVMVKSSDTLNNRDVPTGMLLAMHPIK